MENFDVNTADPVVATESTSNLQRLHENLSKLDGFNVPLDQFESDMQDENNLKRLHENLSKKDGFNVPYDNFKTDMWGAQPETEQPVNQEVPASEGVGFGERISAHGKKGLADLYTWVADLPKTAYRIAAIPQNAIATVTGADWLRADPEKISELTGLKNPVSEYYQGVSDQQQKIIQKDPTANEGIVNAFADGHYATGFKNLAGSVIESAPSTILMMLSGAGGLKAIETAKASGQLLPYLAAQFKSYAPVTGVFAGSKLRELDKEAPNLPEETKASIALGSGFVEQLFEQQFGAGAVGEAFAKIIKNEGKDKAKAIIGNGIKNTFSDLLTKYPALSPIGEGFEEMGTQITQNIIDKYSGYKPDLKVTDGVLDAGLAGVTMGGAFAGGLTGAKYLVNNKSPQVTGPVSSDSTPIPTIDPRSQAEMTAREFHQANANPETGIMKSITEKKPVGIPNDTHFVLREWDEPGIEEGTTRHMYGVTAPDGSFKQFQKGPGIIENSDALTEDQYVNQQLSNFDQQHPKDLSNQGADSGSYPVDPALKAQIEKDTAPAYSIDGKEISKDEYYALVNTAIKLKDKTELDGLSHSNDPIIDKAIEKAWPKPPVVFKIKGVKVERSEAVARITHARTIEKLNDLKIENIDLDPEIKDAFEKRKTELSPKPVVKPTIAPKLTEGEFYNWMAKNHKDPVLRQKATDALSRQGGDTDVAGQYAIYGANYRMGDDYLSRNQSQETKSEPVVNPEKITGPGSQPAKFTLFGKVATPQQALLHIKFANDLNDLNELQHENIDSDPTVKAAYDAAVNEFAPSQVAENVNNSNLNGENISVNSKDNAMRQLVASQQTPEGSQNLQQSENQNQKSYQNEESTSQPGQITGASTGETIQSNTQGPAPVSEAGQSTYGKANKVVTESRYEELKRKLREKRNTLNSGIDPELLTIGAQMAAYHIEAGARKFADFSRQMIADMVESIKPHLKNLYEQVRQHPEMEQHKTFMDDPESVKAADIDQLLKNEPVSGDLSNGNNQNRQTTTQTGNIPMNQFVGANQTTGAIPPRSVNQKVEANLKTAHGITGEPLLDKFKRWGQEIKETSQHFKHITQAEFPSIYNKLRLFEAIPDAVKKDAYERISAIVRPIVKDKAPFEAFERHIVLQDLLADVRRGMFKGKSLPWGYENVSEIEQDANSMAAYVNNNPLLKDVLNKRQEMMGQVRDQLIENGILSPKSKNDSYFHHQVLDYMNARQRQDVGVSSKDARLHEKGWQRSRTGSMKAYNTNYLESEFEVLAQSLEKLEMKKSLNKIGSEVNIMSQLVEKAKEEGGKWSDHIPEGYVKWFPKSGTNAYKAATIAERAAQNIMHSVDSELADNVQDLIAEADKSLWVIPEKIARQMDSMRTPEKEIIPVRIMRAFNSFWKQWVLLSPFRVLKYNLNNMSGDADIVMAYNPAILKPEYAHTAMKELWNDLKGHGMSPDIKEALEQGVITSGLSIQEIPDINKEGVFKSLTGDDNLAMKYWGASKDYTQFRENLLRIAAYKYFKEQVSRGKSVYGVSDKKAVDALTDTNEKAGKLARELLGDYGNLSQGGQWLRSHVYPFWSWVEINSPRYYRLLKNTAYEGQSTAGTGARVAGVAAKKTATNIVTTSAKMLTLAGLVSLWNWTFFPDEDDELSKTGNRQLKLILGRREDGSIMSIRFSGAFADMLSFVGLEDAPQDFRDLKTGDATIGKKFKEAGSAFANKMVQGAMPVEKTAAEAALGRSLYPDIFNPRPIRDKAEHVLRSFSMDKIYRYLTKKPLRGIAKEAEGLIVYDTDPGEAAYYTVRQKIYDFLQKEGVESTSGEPTQRSNALFYYKQSLKMKDSKLAEHWLNEYIKEGGTKQGYKSSLQRGVVTSPLPKNLREKWWDTLDGEDKELIDIANAWYEETYLNSDLPDKSKPLLDVLKEGRMESIRPEQKINPFNF
jgi:hypothetical protein